MLEQLYKDSLSWDTHNWGKALTFWKHVTDLENKKLKCLELGSRRGGLSLWLASKGHEVICSDLSNPEKEASILHQKYGVQSISYQAINALEIPFESEFDLIVFKSILGGVSMKGQDQNKQIAIDQIYNALKKGGKLLFAENLEASLFHKKLRKNYTTWGENWNYLKLGEIPDLFHKYSNVDYKTAGFLGTLGRKENQKILLGKADDWLETFLPANLMYLVYGIAKK